MKVSVLNNYKAVGKKNGGGSFESGTVKVKTIKSIEKLHKTIIKVAKTDNACLAIGNFKSDGRVVPKSKKKKGVLTRTAEDMLVGNVLVVDNDTGREFDFTIFEKYWEALKGVGRVRTLSGSTLLGKKENGTHDWVLFDKVFDLKGVMNYLEAVCILEGKCFIDYQATGKAVVKTPVDIKLNEAQMPVYEDDTNPTLITGEVADLSKKPKNYRKVLKKADVKKEKMLGDKKVLKKSKKIHKKWLKTQDTSVKGKSVDLTNREVDESFKLYRDGKCVGSVGDLLKGKIQGDTFSDLYEPDYGDGSQKAKYFKKGQMFHSQAHGGINYHIKVSEKWKKKNYEKLKKKKSSTVKETLDTSVDKFMRKGNPSTDAVLGFKRKGIGYKFVDFTDDVSLDLAIHSYIKKKKKKDPTSKHSIVAYRKSAKTAQKNVRIFKAEYDKWVESVKFEEEEKEKQSKAEDTLEKRYKNYYKYIANHELVAGEGGNTIMVSKSIDDDGKDKITYNTLSGDREEWADRMVLVSVVNNKGTIENKKMNVVDVALKGVDDVGGKIDAMHRHKGLAFRPAQKLTKAYNLFNGFPITPKKGDITIWKKTMSKAVGKRAYKIIMDWFAHMYQKPQEKVLYAIVLKGEKGTGKNTFEQALGRSLLSNPNYFSTADQTQLFGKFNMFLATNLLTVGQEIVWGGKHSYDSQIKTMITEGSRTAEAKGKEAFTIENYSRLFITSNAEWVVPATKGERRFYVTTTKQVHSLDVWNTLYKWLEKDSSKQALMYEMMHRDISDFERLKAPHSKELEEQVEETLHSESRFIAEALENGYFGRGEHIYYIGGKEENLKTKDIHNIYLETARQSGMNTVKSSMRSLAKKLKLYGYKIKHTKIGNIGTLPPLKKMCKKFNKVEKTKVICSEKWLEPPKF